MAWQHRRIYFVRDYFDLGSGWCVEGMPGCFDSFTSALAANMGFWDEYCEYHRTVTATGG